MSVTMPVIVGALDRESSNRISIFQKWQIKINVPPLSYVTKPQHVAQVE